MTAVTNEILLTFVLLGVLVFGVIRYKWYIDVIAGLFLAMGLVIALTSRMNLSQAARHFVAGAKDMVGVVMIVACARALSTMVKSLSSTHGLGMRNSNFKN